MRNLLLAAVAALALAGCATGSVSPVDSLAKAVCKSGGVTAMQQLADDKAANPTLDIVLDRIITDPVTVAKFLTEHGADANAGDTIVVITAKSIDTSRLMVVKDGCVVLKAFFDTAALADLK